MLKVLHVAGARPNFMKVAPVMRALKGKPGIRQYLVHTGQHYDAAMSDVFFADLNLPAPDINLGVGGGTHAQQTARVMLEFERVCEELRPDIVVVVGDVNSSLSAALVAAKLGIPVAHVEAGLRSFDMSMPEEINRVLIDRVAEYLFTPSWDANANLMREGVPNERIHLVGNVMIDSLVYVLPRARRLNIFSKLGVSPGQYGFVTFHRPANVDCRNVISWIVDNMCRLQESMDIVFPVHPRTRRRLKEFGLDLKLLKCSRIRLIEPLSYVETLALVDSAGIVITDSGGLQEETTFLGVPCVTVRPNTERPVTITEGTNVLCSPLSASFMEIVRAQLDEGRKHVAIKYWDGRAAERIANCLVS